MMISERRINSRESGLVADLVVLSALLTSFAIAENAAAAEWTVVDESSTVTMYATREGAWITGVFEEFSAVVNFDPEDPVAGKIIGTVATASVDTSDAQNNAYVHGYLDVEQFPESRFESATIEQTADGFRASGELVLAGHTRTVTLDFTFTSGNEPSVGTAVSHLSGTIVVNRFEFDIASEIDVNTAGRDVIVQVELDLKP